MRMLRFFYILMLFSGWVSSFGSSFVEAQGLDVVASLDGGPMNAVEVRGNYAFVASWTGLVVMDISDIADPRMVQFLGLPQNTGTGGSSPHITLDGNNAYISSGENGLFIVDISDPLGPTLIGSYDSPGNLMSVTISGSYAYLADRAGGYRVLDISNPTAPASVGHYATGCPTWHSIIRGNYAYVANGSCGFLVLDISNPIAPSLVGSVGTFDFALWVDVDGDFAYIADYEGGLTIIDVSNPAVPSVAANLDTPDWASFVQVEGDHAFLADWYSVKIFDVFNPAAPVEIASYRNSSVGTYVDRMEVKGDYLYIPSGSSFSIVDISNPSAPFQASLTVSGTSIEGIEIRGGYAYLATRFEGLVILDITNRDAPRFLSSIEIYHSVDIAVQGRYAYIANYQDNLKIVDISDPLFPIQVGAFDNNPGWSTAIALAGNYAYVATWDYGLQIIDISDPTAPVQVGLYNTVTDINDVWLVGNLAYVVDLTSGLRIIDVSNPATPVEIGFFSIAEDMYKVAVQGSFAYVSSLSAMRILDVSNPTAPAEVGSVPVVDGTAVMVDGRFAYISEYDSGLVVVDVSNPATPIVAGFFANRGFGATNGLVKQDGHIFFGNRSQGLYILDEHWHGKGKVSISGTTAYATDGLRGLKVYDVSTESTPVETSTFDTSGFVTDVVASGNRAYVADKRSGLRILNTTNPASLSEVGYYDSPGNAQGVFLEGNKIYLADGLSGLAIVDITNEASPALVGSLDTPGNAHSVVVTGGFAYLADGSGGLRVIDVLTPSLPFEVSSLTTPGEAREISIYGDYAYLADAYGGLRVIDISNPYSPFEVGDYNTGERAFGLNLSGTTALVADEGSGISLVDVYDPFSPQLLTYLPVSGSGAAVTLNGNYAYSKGYDEALEVFTVGFAATGNVSAGGAPLSGVTINAEHLGTAATDVSGNYDLGRVFLGASYELTPSRAGYSFTPAKRTGTISANIVADFTATLDKHSLTGTVRVQGTPLPGVTISAGALGSTTTDGLGQYSFSNIDYGTSYTLTPSLTGYTFSSTEVNGSLLANAEQDFSATLNTYQLSGTVLFGGAALAGTVVDGGALGQAVTDLNGVYAFSAVPYGTNYTLLPQKLGYGFTPTGASGTLTGATTANFTASDILAPGPPVISTPVSSSVSSNNVPVISGTAEAGSQVQIYRNGTLLGAVAAEPTGGSWSLSSGTIWSDGEYTLTATATDAAGNTSAVSTAVTFRIDTYDPETADSDNDGLTDAEETASGTNPSDEDSDDDTIPDGEEIALGTNPLTTDSDNDGVDDGQEVEDSSNPVDPGSNLPRLSPTVCTEWNGFLGMWNILEQLNLGDRKSGIETTLYNLAGKVAGKVSYNIQPGRQYDLLVHSTTGYVADSYGRICATSNGQAGEFDGRMVFYKPDYDSENRLSGYQFAFAMALGNGLAGRQYVAYNTYQPSLDPGDGSNLVANWIQITNLGTSRQKGKLVFYDIAGVIVAERNVELAGGARLDYSGHDAVGLSKVGLVEWIPENSETKFQLRNVRYLYEEDGEAFASAFQLEGSYGSGELLAVPLDTVGSSSVIEVANVSSENVKVEVAVYREEGGTALLKKTYSLSAHATKHIVADSILGSDKRGLATIKGNRSGSIVATAMQYGRSASLGISNLYGIIARQALGSVLRGSYNTFLNQGCRLLVMNPSESAVDVRISLTRYDGTTPLNNLNKQVPSHGLLSYDLCAVEVANAYGVVKLVSNKENSLVASVLRLGENDQYRFPTMVR